MPSPGGQVCGMASHENYCGRAGLAGCGIPSTSQRGYHTSPSAQDRRWSRRLTRISAQAVRHNPSERARACSPATTSTVDTRSAQHASADPAAELH